MKRSLPALLLTTSLPAFAQDGAGELLFFWLIPVSAILVVETWVLAMRWLDADAGAVGIASAVLGVVAAVATTVLMIGDVGMLLLAPPFIVCLPLTLRLIRKRAWKKLVLQAAISVVTLGACILGVALLSG